MRAASVTAALAIAAVAAAVSLAEPLGRAQSPPPSASPLNGSTWINNALDVAPGSQSARILLGDQPLLAGPSGAAARRGSAARDAHLPLFATKRGDGCKGSWLQVGPLAWVCEDAVEVSTVAPIEVGRRMTPASFDGLPYRYYFVGPAGSAAYKKLEEVDVGEPDMMLQPGFAVAIVADRVIDGAHYGRTAHNLWVAMRDLGPVRTFVFRGAELAGTRETRDARDKLIPAAWVLAEKAHVLSRPSALALTSASRSRFDALEVLEHHDGPSGGFFRIGENEWIAAKDVRHPTLAEPPGEVDADAGERWIDVDLETQTLVFATLVSTGKGKPGTPMGTPRGTFRVWIKLLTSDMDNLEDDNAARYYRMEDVPWVQYFSKGVGLHGAFWHRSFGQVRSHGCVNLSPLDAERLFWWTSPHIPAGWTAAFPTQHELGTLVRVR
jgi:hypothetical protein